MKTMDKAELQVLSILSAVALSCLLPIISSAAPQPVREKSMLEQVREHLASYGPNRALGGQKATTENTAQDPALAELNAKSGYSVDDALQALQAPYRFAESMISMGPILDDHQYRFQLADTRIKLIQIGDLGAESYSYRWRDNYQDIQDVSSNLREGYVPSGLTTVVSDVSYDFVDTHVGVDVELLRIRGMPIVEVATYRTRGVPLRLNSTYWR